MHAAQMLGNLADELAAAGIRLQAVEARSSVRERLRREGVDAKLGVVNRFTSVADAVEAFEPARLTGEVAESLSDNTTDYPFDSSGRLD